MAELGNRKKLQLSDAQLASLIRSSTTIASKLIDYGAEMAKQDLKLQTLVDADVPDETQVNVQVDQVLAARGKLEREYTLMNLDLRKVLSLEQWRQLKSLRGTGRGPGRQDLFPGRCCSPGEVGGSVSGGLPGPPGAYTAPAAPPSTTTFQSQYGHAIPQSREEFRPICDNPWLLFCRARLYREAQNEIWRARFFRISNTTLRSR